MGSLCSMLRYEHPKLLSLEILLQMLFGFDMIAALVLSFVGCSLELKLA